MTQIYTSNTVLVKSKAPIVNFFEGDSATLIADVNIIWINPGTAQRFLTHNGKNLLTMVRLGEILFLEFLITRYLLKTYLQPKPYLY